MGPHHGHDFRIEEAVSWPTLHAGSRVSYTPKSSGPWTVYFVIQGKGVTATTEASHGQVTLMRTGNGFHAQTD
jgi:hypothetical protein